MKSQSEKAKTPSNSNFITFAVATMETKTLWSYHRRKLGRVKMERRSRKIGENTLYNILIMDSCHYTCDQTVKCTTRATR